LSLQSLLPLLPLFLILGTDVWVYSDAKAQCGRGTPVVFTLGQFRIDDPTGWVLACTFLWIIFFPLYLVGRRN
jgi:hypothetical protein